MATIHDLSHPNILTLSYEEAFELVKQRRGNRRLSKRSAKKQRAASTRKQPATAKELAGKLGNAELAQLIQEMEARLG